MGFGANSSSKSACNVRALGFKRNYGMVVAPPAGKNVIRCVSSWATCNSGTAWVHEGLVLEIA